MRQREDTKTASTGLCPWNVPKLGPYVHTYVRTTVSLHVSYALADYKNIKCDGYLGKTKGQIGEEYIF